MNVLILTARPIRSRRNGYDLRVAQLCAHTPGPLHLVVVPLEPPEAGEQTLPTEGLFDSVETLKPFEGHGKHPLRHLRLSNDHFLALAYPQQFAEARDRLQTIMRERRICQVVVFGGALGELAATLRPSDVIIDVCDSISLTARREIEFSASAGTGRRLLLPARLDLHRVRVTEGRLPRRFRQVTTISPADTRELETLAGPSAKVATIPNGVDPAFLTPLGVPASLRGVTFWGNLAFGPNVEALRFFLRDVYHPVLRPAGIQFAIFGPNPPRWLIDVADSDPGVRVEGQVPDLRAGVTRYPLMVNPMRTGSGLKNKVLEAFGLGSGGGDNTAGGRGPAGRPGWDPCLAGAGRRLLRTCHLAPARQRAAATGAQGSGERTRAPALPVGNDRCVLADFLPARSARFPPASQ
jgi:hypothetical protein